MTDEKAAPPDPKRKLFFGLFVFPLLVAVGMAALLCMVVFLTHEEETPETLITAIKTGSPSKRWQKAFELSNELNRRPEMIRSKGVMGEILHILGDSERYDSKTRSYMAMALSRFQEPEAVEAVRKRLKEETEEVQLYLIWALGNLNAREAAGDLEPFLASSNPDLRQMAAYVSGVLGDKETAARLRPLLKDPVTDVSWNAALSLARLGDDSGAGILMKMLDRNALTENHRLSKTQAEKIMVNAAKGLGRIKNPESDSLLRSLAENDESLQVRQAALEALKKEEVSRA
ncbi:MAG: HEAT repeat domain-containing protein [Candidatus Omnitrophica bacterium]|nr:HEAT repeat domain-containing protein [Candidatus Omnitrophota bacterium]